MTDNIPRKMEPSASSATIIVDIVYWNLSHAELIENTLSTGGISVAIASYTLIDIVVVDLSIEHGFNTSFEPKLSVINLTTGLDELRHAYTEDVAWLIAFDNHFGDMEVKKGALKRETDVAGGICIIRGEGVS